MKATLAAVLRAGIAVHNAGEHHAAHDAWEDRWLRLERGSDDERLLHGLIQFTAAVYHARNRNWAGASGLADSAGDYLNGLPSGYREVNVDAVRAYLRRLRVDPEFAERRRPLRLRHGGRAPSLADLGFDAAAVAARVLAAKFEGYDESVLARATEYAHEELRDEEGARTRFTALVMDFAADADNRPLVYRRLREHVDRRDRRAEDVEGLFDPGNGDA